MARLSASSSAEANGHAKAAANAGSAQPSRGYTSEDFDFDSPSYKAKARQLPFDTSFLPTGSRSLSHIGLQAFFLGVTLAACLLTTTHLALTSRPIWRLPSLFACLSFFHFLEYWTTAHFNTPATRASSFLLYDNGRAYNIAHTLAALEIIVSNFLPSYQSFCVNTYTISIGLLLVIVGQLVRSVAMAQAGTNFNHMPQRVRREGHELVTMGVYAWLRHPSYFGFFWWAVGTQVLVGNKICFMGYSFVLWEFFRKRIVAEEKTLIEFFGKEYEDYRQRTPTRIPLVR